MIAGHQPNAMVDYDSQEIAEKAHQPEHNMQKVDALQAMW